MFYSIFSFFYFHIIGFINLNIQNNFFNLIINNQINFIVIIFPIIIQLSIIFIFLIRLILVIFITFIRCFKLQIEVGRRLFSKEFGFKSSFLVTSNIDLSDAQVQRYSNIPPSFPGSEGIIVPESKVKSEPELEEQLREAIFNQQCKYLNFQPPYEFEYVFQLRYRGPEASAIDMGDGSAVYSPFIYYPGSLFYFCKHSDKSTQIDSFDGVTNRDFFYDDKYTKKGYNFIPIREVIEGTFLKNSALINHELQNICIFRRYVIFSQYVNSISNQNRCVFFYKITGARLKIAEAQLSRLNLSFQNVNTIRAGGYVDVAYLCNVSDNERVISKLKPQYTIANVAKIAEDFHNTKKTKFYYHKIQSSFNCSHVYQFFRNIWVGSVYFFSLFVSQFIDVIKFSIHPQFDLTEGESIGSAFLVFQDFFEKKFSMKINFYLFSCTDPSFMSSDIGGQCIISSVCVESSRYLTSSVKLIPLLLLLFIMFCSILYFYYSYNYRLAVKFYQENDKLLVFMRFLYALYFLILGLLSLIPLSIVDNGDVAVSGFAVLCKYQINQCAVINTYIIFFFYVFLLFNIKYINCILPYFTTFRNFCFKFNIQYIKRFEQDTIALDSIFIRVLYFICIFQFNFTFIFFFNCQMEYRFIRIKAEVGFSHCFTSLKQPQHEQQKILFNAVYCNIMVYRDPLYPADSPVFSDPVRDQTELLYYIFSPCSFYVCNGLVMIQDLLGFYGDNNHIQYLDPDFFKYRTKHNSKYTLCSSSIILGQSDKRRNF